MNHFEKVDDNNNFSMVRQIENNREVYFGLQTLLENLEFQIRI